MPKPYPKEFRDDVVRVARNREHGVRIAFEAKDEWDATLIDTAVLLTGAQ